MPSTTTADLAALLRDAAIEYARRGLRVIPLYPLTRELVCTCRAGAECGNSSGKHPWLREWQKKATTDERQILHWWRERPLSGIGIATGAGSGIIALDVDPRHNGDETLRTLIASYGELPATPINLTGSGGQHYCFRHPGRPVPNDAQGALGPGLDIRGDGGLIVVEPSLHYGGRCYAWDVEAHLFDIPPAAMPDWMVSMLCGRSGKPSTAPLPDRIPQGQRNSALASLGGAMRRRGASEQAILAALAQENSDRCDPPLSAEELEQIARSVGRYSPEPDLRVNLRKTQGGGGEQVTVDLTQFPCTDLGNAERLLALHGPDLRYVPPWRSWITWDGQSWVKNSDASAIGVHFGAAYRMAAEMVRETAAQMERKQVDDAIRKGWRSHIKSSEGHGKLSACLEVAARYSGISIEELDSHPHLLPVANGTIDLRTRELLPHRRENYITRLVDIPYDPGALCPTWERFMRDIFPQGEELANWVWRALGYCLTGEVSERVVFFLWGGGRNGKSTLLEAFADLVSPYAACIDSKVILTRRFDDGSSHELAQLPGKRYVFTSETGQGRSLNEARIKALSGSDTIQACAKYEAPFSFRPQFKLFLATNSKPVIRGADDAIWVRIRLIPFERRFYTSEEERAGMPDAIQADRTLRDRLRAELPGALARCVRSACEWYADGLGTERHVTEATASYREDSDVMGDFLRERCRTGRGLYCRSSKLWTAYQAWCERNGENKGTRKAFGQLLQIHGFEPFDYGRHDKAHWRGIDVIDSAEEEEEQGEEGYEPGATG